LTKGSNNPILNLDVLLSVVQWFKANSSRNISCGSDELEQAPRKEPSPINENSWRNGIRCSKGSSEDEGGQ